MPSALRRSKLIREWMQPWPKCPYIAPRSPYLSYSFIRSRM